ncbi:MAG: hypothetical protein PHR06_04710 [Candidatus Cloacimonetes bacterium]|nr:hypothetical protein [Candidatus Cloacimonadota bacterium]
MKLWILLILVVLTILAGIILLEMSLPKGVVIVKKIEINAPKEIVLESIRHWKNWEKWSVWLQNDSLNVVRIEGNDGEIGSSLFFGRELPLIKGDRFIYSRMIPNLEHSYRVTSNNSSETVAETYFRVLEKDGVSTASWGYNRRYRLTDKIANLFSDSRQIIETDFEKSLIKLKEFCEKEFALKDIYEVKEGFLDERFYVIFRREVALRQVHSFLEKSGDEILREMKNLKQKASGPLSAFYFDFYPSSQTTDMATAYMVNDRLLSLEFEDYTIYKSKICYIDYFGSPDNISEAYKSLDIYLNQRKYTLKKPVIEEYVVNWQVERDRSKWHTRIIYLVNEK